MTTLALVLEALGALALGAAAAYLVSALARRSSGEQLDERVRRFAEAGAGLAISMPEEGGTGSSPAAGAFAGLRRLLLRVRRDVEGPAAVQRPREAKVAEALARADLKLRPMEWYLIRAASVVVLGLIGLALYRNVIFAAVLAVVGLFAPPLVLRYRAHRRLRRFNDQLGDTLILLSNALKAGYSFPQAMASISRSASPPISEEFARATREVQLGVTTDEALAHMVTRIESDDLDLVVTAVQIQRVVGGNLAEILDTIAFTIRERIRIKGEIRTLTAQARASSYIITGLPVLLVLVLQALNPTYISPLLSFAGPGPYILGGCILSIIFAFFVMRRISNIEV
ncbi:MAG: type II secretion system F family protein [Candidatus Dormibacteria bacterium]